MANSNVNENLVIIQGSNTPITLTFEESMGNYQDIHVALCSSPSVGSLYKHWDISDVDISEKVVTCPLTQIETFNLPIGKLYLQVRAIDAEGDVRNYQVLEYTVVGRSDTHILKPRS